MVLDTRLNMGFIQNSQNISIKVGHQASWFAMCPCLLLVEITVDDVYDVSTPVLMTRYY